jgi:ATP-binding cassette, subfamily C (CFTR/MRP), member 1
VSDPGVLRELKPQSFAWDRTSPPSLIDLNVEFSIGTISVVVWPVGSGKSSLLKAMLREMICTMAPSRIGVEPRRKSGSVAYCSQKQWLENTTIRQNIVGASPLEPTWYETVKTLCGLDSDIA